MKTASSLVHERIDDVPLLIGLAQKLRLPELLDRTVIVDLVTAIGQSGLMSMTCQQLRLTTVD